MEIIAANLMPIQYQWLFLEGETSGRMPRSNWIFIVIHCSGRMLVRHSEHLVHMSNTFHFAFAKKENCNHLGFKSKIHFVV